MFYFAKKKVWFIAFYVIFHFQSTKCALRTFRFELSLLSPTVRVNDREIENTPGYHVSSASQLT